MKVSEAWKLSKNPYTELTFRSVELTRGSQSFGSQYSDPAKRVRSVLRGARISKIAFSFFIAFGSLIPFVAFYFHRTPFTLATSISLMLAISLGYSIVYSFQVLPSFAQAGPYSLLMTLPLTEADFALISMFSFVRTFDLIVLTGVTAQFLIIGLFTSSALAALGMLVISIANFVFGIALGLRLSELFYKNITRGGRSRAGTIARFLFLITWGSVGLFFWLFFDYVNYIVPYLSALLSGSLSHGVAVLLVFVHPFPEAIAISSIAFGSSAAISHVIILESYAATASYVALAGYVAFSTRRSVSVITHGNAFRIVRRAAKNFQLKIRVPVAAYVLKDLRIASKSPQAAIIFVLPLFETVIVAISISGLSSIGPSSIVATTTVGTFFTLFAATTLLNTEGYGLEYTMSLPIGARVIVFAKSVVATLTFIPIPIVVILLGQIRGYGLGIIAAVPFVEIIGVGAATTAQLSFFISTQKRKRLALLASGVKSEGAFTPTGFSVLSGRDLTRLGKSLAVGATLLYAPLVSYFSVAAEGSSPLVSVGAMLVVAVAEFVIVQLLLKRSAYS